MRLPATSVEGDEQPAKAQHKETPHVDGGTAIETQLADSLSDPT